MTAASAVTSGRAFVESLLVDACVVRRAGAATWNETLGREVPGTAAVVYAGRCRVQVPHVQAQTPTAGEFVWTIQDVALQLPMSAPIPKVGDDVEVTACPLDALLVGRMFRVKASVPPKTHATRRTVACTEVTD